VPRAEVVGSGPRWALFFGGKKGPWESGPRGGRGAGNRPAPRDEAPPAGAEPRGKAACWWPGRGESGTPTSEAASRRPFPLAPRARGASSLGAGRFPAPRPPPGPFPSGKHRESGTRPHDFSPGHALPTRLQSGAQVAIPAASAVVLLSGDTTRHKAVRGFAFVARDVPEIGVFASWRVACHVTQDASPVALAGRLLRLLASPDAVWCL
jgi:hypothetical protein